MAAHHDPMGPRCLATALAGIALLATPAGAAPNDGGGNDDAPPCITVEVNGQRALPYECYQEKMAPSHAGGGGGRGGNGRGHGDGDREGGCHGSRGPRGARIEACEISSQA